MCWFTIVTLEKTGTLAPGGQEFLPHMPIRLVRLDSIWFTVSHWSTSSNWSTGKTREETATVFSKKPIFLDGFSKETCS
jgi:hypothetical protein